VRIVPIGYLVTTGLAAGCTALALAPRHRPHLLAILSFRIGIVVSELPFLVFYYLLAATALAIGQHDIDSPLGWVAFGLAVATAAGLAVIAWRGLRDGLAIDHAMTEALGADWLTAIDPETAGRLRRRLPLASIARAPLWVRRGDVERIANLSYGDAGTANQLDIYRHRSRPERSPVLIHLHGGRFVSGSKNRESRPLLYHLASRGWLCISANYRLSPAARFPDQLADAKRVIAWVRDHTDTYGADPSIVFIAGSSAGAHIASMAALTQNDPAFQPGFESADTSITAAIGMGGYYGPIDADGDRPASPLAYLNSEAPPFFVAHGDRDTFVPVEAARLFVDQLRASSTNPVVYAELHGAPHTFDLFHSLRFEALVNAIEAFTAWVRANDRAQPR
jgi:acetyl esterase/lipase